MFFLVFFGIQFSHEISKWIELFDHAVEMPAERKQGGIAFAIGSFMLRITIAVSELNLLQCRSYWIDGCGPFVAVANVRIYFLKKIVQ